MGILDIKPIEYIELTYTNFKLDNLAWIIDNNIYERTENLTHHSMLTLVILFRRFPRNSKYKKLITNIDSFDCTSMNDRFKLNLDIMYMMGGIQVVDAKFAKDTKVIFSISIPNTSCEKSIVTCDQIAKLYNISHQQLKLRNNK